MNRDVILLQEAIAITREQEVRERERQIREEGVRIKLEAAGTLLPPELTTEVDSAKSAVEAARADALEAWVRLEVIQAEANRVLAALQAELKARDAGSKGPP